MEHRLRLTRRAALQTLAWGAALAVLARPSASLAQNAQLPFEQWVAAFRSRAIARGISEATYTRVMHGLNPDTTVYKELRNQPEFNEQLWQYLNRRVSEWRIVTGKEKAKEYAPLLSRSSRSRSVFSKAP